MTSSAIPSQTPASVATVLRDLIYLGQFGITEASYDAERFGNVRIVAESSVFGIRYTRDRDDDLLEVLVDGDSFSVTDVADVITGSVSEDLRSADEELRFFASRWRDIKTALSEPAKAQTVKQLVERRKLRLRKMFPGAIVDG